MKDNTIYSDATRKFNGHIYRYYWQGHSKKEALNTKKFLLDKHRAYVRITNYKLDGKIMYVVWARGK
jgi:hypothetical protein